MFRPASEAADPLNDSKRLSANQNWSSRLEGAGGVYGDSRAGPNHYALGSFTYLTLIYICELIKVLGAIDLPNSVTAGVPPALNFYSHEGFSAEGVIGAVRHSECTRS